MSEAPKYKRRPATAARKAEIIALQGPNCAFKNDRGVRCTMPIQIWEHGWDGGLPVGLGNEDMPNAGLCRGHAYLKTVNEDNPRMLKADKQGGRKGQQSRRAAGKTKKIPPRPFPKGQRKMGSRPFPKRPR